MFNQVPSSHTIFLGFWFWRYHTIWGIFQVLFLQIFLFFNHCFEKKNSWGIAINILPWNKVDLPFYLKTKDAMKSWEIILLLVCCEIIPIFLLPYSPTSSYSNQWYTLAVNIKLSRKKFSEQIQLVHWTEEFWLISELRGIKQDDV